MRFLLPVLQDALDGVLEAAPPRLEDSLLDFGETPEVGRESLEDVPVKVVQVPVQLRGGAIQGGVVLLRPGRDAGSWVPQEVFPDPTHRRGPVRGKEGEGLAGPQRVPVGDLRQADLFLLAEGAEREGHGERQAPRVEARLELRGEPAEDRDPLVDPAGPVAEELADRFGAQAVLVDVRCDDAGLVHGARRPPGGVGLEHPRLVEERVDLLDDHRRLAQALPLTPPQPLEAVDHLVGPARLLPDPDGKRRQRVPRVGSVAP